MSQVRDTRVSVVIPTWKGARYLPDLITALRSQIPALAEILVIDSSSPDGSAAVATGLGCQVMVVSQADFNHGGTRNLAARATTGDMLVFLTQDAVPTDPHCIARLIAPLRDGTAAAAFARQIPYDQATPPERMARARNYPEVSQLRQAADIPRLGVRAYFFSNVASAVTRSAFDEAGGFPDDVIMNEDMVLCSRLLHAGQAISYRADAIVRHSHDYSLAQQFRRYFDIGVFFSEHGHLLPQASTGGEGLRFACLQITWLLGRGHVFWAIRSPFESACKYAGFHLGRFHRRLPQWMLKRCSMHAFHFTRKATPQSAR